MASTMRTLSIQLLPKALDSIVVSRDAAGSDRDCSRAQQFRSPFTNQTLARRASHAASRRTALSGALRSNLETPRNLRGSDQTLARRASLAASRRIPLFSTRRPGLRTPQSRKGESKAVRAAAVATGEEGESSECVAGDRPPFDLNLAVLLAGFAFESYNTPQEQKETLWEEDVGGCRTIFTSYGFAYELYSGQLVVTVQSASNVPAVDLWGTSDPYVLAAVGEASVRTRTIWTSTEPEWNEEVRLLVKADDTGTKYLKLSMWDDGIVISPRRLGNASIRLDDLLDGETHEQEVALEGPGGGATLKLAVRYRSFAELAEEERNRWRLPSLDDIFSGQLPLVSGFQDVMTAAFQSPTTTATPAAESSPDSSGGSPPTTSQPSPAISSYEFVRSAIQQFGGAAAFPSSLDQIKDSVIPPPPPSSPQASSLPAEAADAAENTLTRSDSSIGREQQVRQAVGLAREVLLRAGWIPAGGTLDQLSQAVIGTTSNTGETSSSSGSGDTTAAAGAAASQGGLLSSLVPSGAIGDALAAVDGLRRKREELRSTLTDMGFALPWADTAGGADSKGGPAGAAAAAAGDIGAAATAAAGGLLEGAASAVAGRIQQRRAELRRSLTDLGISLPWYDQTEGGGADGQRADGQSSTSVDVTASQEPSTASSSSFSSSLDDLRKAAFRQTEGLLGSLALLGSTAGSLPLAEEKKILSAPEPEGDTGGGGSEGSGSERASEVSVVGEEEAEEARRMFGSAETAVEAWTMLASSLGQQTFVKSEFDKICFLDHPESDTQVALWRDVRRKRVVVAFRGTEQTKLKDLLTDISLSPSSLDPERTSSGDFDQDVMVHGGFLAAYDSVRARLRSLIALITDPDRSAPLTAQSDAAATDADADADSSIHSADSLSGSDTWRVYLTGHSLGGALSTLFAYELSQSNLVRDRNIHLTMYNYGSPRVGNAAFVARFNAHVADSWRIVNRSDIIPTVPKLMGYRHVCCPVYLSPGGPSGDLQSDASKEEIGVDDGYAAEVVGEANPNDILEDYMSGERRLIDRLLQTEVAMLSALRDGSAIMMHMEDFYYIALLKKVREGLGVSQ